jgi:hypothetical protein
MAAVGLLIGIGVCIPFFAGGRLILLDWSFGPTTPIVSNSLLGLNGGLTSGAAGSLLVGLLNWLLGAVASWLPVLLFFPIAFLGVSRLAGGSIFSRLAAGVLYTVNPFVFNRLYVGHVVLLMGYALLPFAVATALRPDPTLWRRAVRMALWWSGLTALDPHFAWIYGVVVVAVAMIALKVELRRSLFQLALTVATFFVMSLYILLPHLATNLPTRTGQASLALFPTAGDPHVGLFANVAGLYGFWRAGPGPTLPKDVISGWPFLLVAVLLIVATGIWIVLRKTNHAVVDRSSDVGHPNSLGELHEGFDVKASTPSSAIETDYRSRLGWLLLVAGVIGYLLALGSQGPTGAIFTWLYFHVPFFAVMREPQKFLMLVALAYAVFFGWGIEHLSTLVVSPKKIGTYAIAIGLGIVLPLAYTPTIFDGLNGQLTLSDIPAAYQQANSLMGKGDGNILALPWHNYLEYLFTSGRVVANVSASTIDRNVISGDNVQSSDVSTQSTSLRSAYLERLFAQGSSLQHFGMLVSPLGIKFVVLAKSVDWLSYSWLARQSDLKLIIDNSALEVWQNLSFEGIAQPVSAVGPVSQFSQVLQLGSKENSNLALVTNGVARAAAQVSRYGPKQSSSPSVGMKNLKVRQLSPVAYQFTSSAPGWVGISEPYEEGWSLNGTPALPTIEGSMIVHVGRGGGVLVFTPWRSARWGYVISGGALALILALILCRRVMAVESPPDAREEAV